MCDGSTDTTDIEREIIYVRVMHEGVPTMKFLKLQPAISGKADGIFATLDEAFQSFDLENWKGKLVGFGADGASVNLGIGHSVSTLLKETAPWLVLIHCVPHCLELASY